MLPLLNPPPHAQWPGHASRNLAALIASASQGDKFSVQALAAAGFDAQGVRARALPWVARVTGISQRTLGTQAPGP